ncbi:hypothetical protein [Chryseobacterium gambrini]|uniref:hypothetical protein n=1 Tax=Chryseobacterium gambrini TaxID=373672 RepID=UPI0022F38F40|nr:hypothetical protein [Chryseobacterium gambrini]WBX99109.1 hypothetical protein PE065_07600 [Chryseobacterium gambrini]
MATKDEITSKINSKIVKDGNIRAVDTNEILRDILDFSNTGITQNTTNINNIEQRIIVLENKPETDDYKPFSFWEESPLKDKRGAYLWYSFRGIEKLSASFTFRLLIKESSVTDFRFQLNDKIIETLKVFFQKPIHQITPISFTVSVNNTKPENESTIVYHPRIWTMYFMISDNIVNFKLAKERYIEDKILEGDEIFTSIHFHCPEFNFDK